MLVHGPRKKRNENLTSGLHDPEAQASPGEPATSSEGHGAPVINSCPLTSAAACKNHRPGEIQATLRDCYHHCPSHAWS